MQRRGLPLNAGLPRRSGASYAWLQKSYRFATQSDASSRFYVVIGAVGARPDHRTYFLDDTHVTIQEL